MNDLLNAERPAIVREVISIEAIAEKANQAHAAVLDAGKTMLAKAIEAGEALLAMKKLVPHGAFRAKCESRCSFGYRTAANYMMLAKWKDNLIHMLRVGVKLSVRTALEHCKYLKMFDGFIPKSGFRRTLQGEDGTLAVLHSRRWPGRFYRATFFGEWIEFTRSPLPMEMLDLSECALEMQKRSILPPSQWHCTPEVEVEFDEEAKGYHSQFLYFAEPETIFGLPPLSLGYERDEDGHIITTPEEYMAQVDMAIAEIRGKSHTLEEGPGTDVDE